MGARTPLLTVFAAAGAAALVLAGCSGIRKAVGAEKVAPDEFRVVTKAPLVVPPEYNLRPPRPGEPRPQELDPAAAARAALYGLESKSGMSDAEQLLLAKAGAGRADPTIRAVIDAEEAGTVKKREGFANRVLFWRDGDTADEKTPVDAASEEERLKREQLAKDAKGEKDVVINRDRGIKLPGL